MEMTEKKEDIPIGVSTFTNIGNTCYLNATLQCLMATDNLVSFFLSDKYKDILKKNIMEKYKIKEDDIAFTEKFRNTMTFTFKNLIHAFWKCHCTIKPEKMRYTLSQLNPVFRGCSQNDSHEAFNYIVDNIHEETKIKVNVKFNPVEEPTKLFIDTLEHIAETPDKIAFCNANLLQYMYVKSLTFFDQYIKSNYSIVFETFVGSSVNATRCCKCKNTNITFETFTSLSVPITDCKTLTECLSKYVATKLLNGEEQYKCDVCKEKVDANVETKIWSLGSKLVIHLKRFTNTTQKINTPITFPFENLDMSPYCCEMKPTKRFYNLYGVVQHSGSAKGGHYIAYTKNLIDKQWYEFNDDQAYIIPDIKSIIDTSDAFVLFYEKMP